jgi:hypothetical protein
MVMKLLICILIIPNTSRKVYRQMCKRIVNQDDEESKEGVSEDRRRWMRARLNRTKNTNPDIVAVPAPRLYTRPPLPSPRAWHVPHDYHLTRAPSDTRQGPDGTILKPRPSSARGPMPSPEPSSGRLSARSTILNEAAAPIARLALYPPARPDPVHLGGAPQNVCPRPSARVAMQPCSIQLCAPV